MHKTIKQSTVLFIILTLLLVLSSASGFAQDMNNKPVSRSGEKMAFDLFILRPAGFLGTLAGSAVFLISLPFSYPGGNHEEALENLVKKPAVYTFKRPIGDF